MVGAVRFELTTSCTRNKRATRLRYAPTQGRKKVPGLEPNCNVEFQNSVKFTLCSFLREWFSQTVPETILGTILNVAAIIIGGLSGLIIRKQPPAAAQS